MNTDNPDKQVDEMMENGLRQYANAAPRLGLEARVLENVRAESARMKMRVRWWPAAIAAAAVLILATGRILNQRLDRTEPVSATANLIAQKTTPSLPVRAKALSRTSFTAPVRHTKRVASTPRRDQFPSPQPLSAQEKILMDYVSMFPREAVLTARLETKTLKEELPDQATKQ